MPLFFALLLVFNMLASLLIRMCIVCLCVR